MQHQIFNSSLHSHTAHEEKKKSQTKCLISFNSMKNQNHSWRAEGEMGPEDPGWHLQDPASYDQDRNSWYSEPTTSTPRF